MTHFGDIAARLLFAALAGFVLYWHMLLWWFKSKDAEYDEEL